MIDWNDSSFYRAALRDGQLIGARSVITRQGTFRFGPPPAKVEVRLMAEEDLTFFYRVADRLFDATSWDDLVAGL